MQIICFILCHLRVYIFQYFNCILNKVKMRSVSYPQIYLFRAEAEVRGCLVIS